MLVVNLIHKKIGFSHNKHTYFLKQITSTWSSWKNQKHLHRKGSCNLSCMTSILLFKIEIVDTNLYTENIFIVIGTSWLKRPLSLRRVRYLMKLDQNYSPNRQCRDISRRNFKEIWPILFYFIFLCRFLKSNSF